MKRVVLLAVLLFNLALAFSISDCNIIDSTILNSTLIKSGDNCTIFNSTIINSTITDSNISSSFVTKSIISNSLVNLSVILTSTIDSSIIPNNSVSDALIKNSVFCSNMAAISSAMSDNILSGGSVLYNNYVFYAPKNITQICSNLTPQKGYFVSNVSVVKNGNFILFRYFGAAHLDVTIDISGLDSTASTISLLDANNKGIYEYSHQISPTNINLDGSKTLFASIADNLGNNLNSSLAVTLDNTAPSASILINEGEVQVTQRNVMLTLNYSDENGVKECRYSNAAFSNELFEPCTPHKFWQLSPQIGLKSVFYQVKDNAGNIKDANATIDYLGFIPDTTAPTTPVVFDGRETSDLDYSNSMNSLSAHWFNSSDAESKLVLYSYTIWQMQFPKNIVSYFGFDGSTNDLLQKNNGTIINGVDGIEGIDCTVRGVKGHACEFHGANQYINLDFSPSLDLTENASIEAWIKLNSLKNNGIVGRDANGFFLGIYSSGKITFGKNGIDEVTSNAVLETNKWYHIACVHKNKTNYIYINSNLDAQGPGDDFDSLNSNLVIGNHFQTDTGWGFNGTIDEVAFYDRPLLGSEINSHFNSGIFEKKRQIYPKDSSLLAFWRMDGDAADYFENYNGSINGGAICNASGKYNLSCSFDGIDGYIRSNLSGTNLSQLSISLWIKSDISQSKGFFQWGQTLFEDTPFIYLSQSAGDFLVYADAAYPFLVPQDLSVWNYFVLTSDGTTWRLYKNGENAGNYSGGLAYKEYADYVYFGNGYAGYFEGKLDDVAIYGRSLSESEIKDNYRNGILKKFENGQLDFAIAKNLNLHEGEIYSFEVTAKNIYNLSSAAVSDGVFIDAKSPLILQLNSTTHPNENITYDDDAPVFEWRATDDFSLKGFSYLLDKNPLTVPDSIIETTKSNATFSNLDSGTYYFHLKAIDFAGNFALWHKKINLKGNPLRITLVQPKSQSYSYLINISGNVTLNSNITIYVNGLNQANISSSGDFIAELNLSNGTNRIYAFAESLNLHATSNAIKVVKLSPQIANLSFSVSFAANSQALSRLAYSDFGSYYFGMATESSLPLIATNPLSISADEIYPALIFFSAKSTDLNSKNDLFEQKKFFDSTAPYFHDKDKNSVFIVLRNPNILFVGNSSLSGRSDLVLENLGKEGGKTKLGVIVR